MSKLKLDILDAPWAVMTEARNRAQRLFETAAARDSVARPAEEEERLSLGEVLYRALVEPIEMAR